MPKPASIINDEYFKSRVNINGENGCWEWNRHLLALGYAQVKVAGKQYRAHRLSYEYYVGPIPAGMIVCHKCDNRKCINPEHLFVGTTQDNVDDKMRKGRFRPCKGEQSGTAKLSAAQIAAIRVDERSQYAIAKEYGISQSNVSMIKRGVTWGTLPAPEHKRLTLKQFADLLGAPYDRFRGHLWRRKEGLRNALEFCGVSV